MAVAAAAVIFSDGIILHWTHHQATQGFTNILFTFNKMIKTNVYIEADVVHAELVLFSLRFLKRVKNTMFAQIIKRHVIVWLCLNFDKNKRYKFHQLCAQHTLSLQINAFEFTPQKPFWNSVYDQMENIIAIKETNWATNDEVIFYFKKFQI